ncbi:MAG: 3-keto-disaccharide hydrolase [Bryobacteraceae bacterium]
MKRFSVFIFLVTGFPLAAQSQPPGDPFVGRWDFNVGTRASWLGITDHGGSLEVWFQPTGGNVYKVQDVKRSGSHLTLNLSRQMTWELDARGGQLTGAQKRGENTTALTGVRAPELKRGAPAAWSKPEPLFNGKNLDGWEPLGSPADSHWVVKEGLLVNEAHGANLKTTRKFDDFKLHFEVNCPDDANSGFYLRGRYEVQLEYEPLSNNPPERRMGSIYGRIAPKGDLPRAPGQWETFDVTLVGRTVTVARHGVTTIDHQEVEGITGGALDANEGEPGPFYIQGDHTGGLKFRNITVSIPR